MAFISGMSYAHLYKASSIDCDKSLGTNVLLNIQVGPKKRRNCVWRNQFARFYRVTLW